ncbi:MAG: xanthine dehydrogenase family protein molybdopterin-binding subunit [Tepidisphaeraceae bacterium]
MQAEPATNPAKRSETFPVGIAGVSIAQAERAVGPNEPPPLPINEKLSVIGKPTPRIDGKLKVTGAAKYTADVKLPGMLYARMIVSPHPHAKITSIDTSAAEAARGVKAIHILDRDFTGAQTKDEPKDKYPRLRYAGQPIGAVAAVTQADADDAARLIKIEYEVLPFVVDLEKARQPDAPLVFTGKAEQAGSAGGGGGPRNVEQHGNVRGPAREARGDIAKGFADAEVTVEGEYRTQVQTHSALETHGVVADWKPDLLTVYASTQGTSSVRDELAAVFSLKKANVRVITEFMGGGFGAKFGAGNYGVLATDLSKKAGAPVRLMLDRRQEHLCVGNRPSSSQKVKIGAKKDGTLTAIQVINFGTADAGTGAGATGPAQNLYKCENLLTEDSDVFTNAGPAAAFRAPGHPQGAFALEQAIDELAERLSIDPLELRDKIDASAARAEERKIGAARIGWSARRKPASDSGPIKKGIGVAQSIWYRFMNPDSHAEVRVTRDGSVELMSGVQDIGTGIRTALAQVVAEELGLKPTDITIRIGDTAYPAGPGSGGSVTTNSITPVARNAAYAVKQQLAEQFAPLLGTDQGDVLFADGKVSSKSNPSNSLTFGAACKKLKTEQVSSVANRSQDYPVPGQAGGRRGGASGGLGGVQFAEVSVDTRTGVIKVDRVVAVHDCGRPINPMGVQSQINGGVIQGISYALYENRILDRKTGLMVNANLEQYKISGSREMPVIEPILIEQYWGRSSTDAAGIGEPATVPTAAAVANAVYNAIGVRIREIPMTPAIVLAALASKNGGASPNKTASGARL